jgi:hypothetical protein
MNSFWLSLLGSLIASAVVLIIDRQRFPKLVVKMDNSVNTTPTYDGRGKWKFIRAQVLNKRMPILLRWLPRQTAENCRATVSFFNEAGEFLFTMRGRWSDTPELPHIPRSEWIERILYPDPVTIIEDTNQTLDVIAMKEGESEAFGWNNEAYLNNWKTQNFKLPKGKYSVKIDITTQNGVSCIKMANLEVGDNIETTFFSKLRF